MDNDIYDLKNYPLVSVLVTSYNREKFIRQTIDSILSQRFQSYEIIICDNCSTDNTMSVLKKYEGHPKIKIYQNDVNIGQFPNRNKIASYARGKYLKYVDSDDVLYPSCLEIMVEAMERFPEAGFGLYSDQDDSRPNPFMLTSNEAYEYHYTKMPIFERSPLGSIIKREAFEKAGGFKDISIAGDFEMWHRLAWHSPLVMIGNGVGWYRVHNAQEMVHYSRNIDQYNAVKAEYLSINKSPLASNLRKQIASREKSSLLKLAMKNILKFKFSSFRKQLQLYSLYDKKSGRKA